MIDDFEELPEDPNIKKSEKKPKRIELRNSKSGNGAIGGIARPYEKDLDPWIAKGWIKVK